MPKGIKVNEDELQAKLIKLVRGRMVKAMRELRDALKTAAPKKTGKMANEIKDGVRVKGNRITGHVYLPFPSRFVDRGHRIIRNGQVIGEVYGKEFVAKVKLAMNNRLVDILEGQS